MLGPMKMTPAGKVARRVEEENIRAEYTEAAKQFALTSMRTAWYEADLKRQVDRIHRLEQAEHREELIQANKELVLLRRARLMSFLTAEAIMFEEELNRMGLAFARER